MWIHGKDSAMWEFWKIATRVGARQEGGRSGGDGRKTELKLSEVNTRGQNELIGGLKMAAGDVIRE